MGDGADESPEKGIPSWQRVQKNPKKPSESQPEVASEPKTSTDVQRESKLAESSFADQSSSGEDDLIAKAKQFLQDDGVRDEPTDKKAAFLRSKGLSEDILEKVMPTDHAKPDITSPAPLAAQQPASSATPSRDVPPIITYPEFLMHANKPPPLTTANRLLNVAYIGSGVAAAIYGMSKYLVAPMSESLHASRHDFAENAKARINELNKKIGDAISIDADQAIRDSQSRHSDIKDLDEASDADSEDSDPTELFHRDYGTQTTAPPSPKPKSSASSSSGEMIANQDDGDGAQAIQLRRLGDLCKDLNSESDSEGDTFQEISTIIRVLKEHLESLSLPANILNANSAYDAFGNPKNPNKKKDEMSNIKNAIRAAKAELLNAKSFPVGRRGNTTQMVSAG